MVDKALTVVVLRDYRPGHFNQSEGVISALQKFCDVEIVYFDIRRKPWIWASLLRWFTVKNLLSKSILLKIAGLRLSEVQELKSRKPDMIISAGGETLVLNLLISRLNSSLNIFSGSLRGIDSRQFSAVLHLDPKLKSKENYIIGLKPSTVERIERPLRRFDSRQYCLLVGGPTRYQPSTPDQWQSLIDSLSSSSKSWDIVTSRRTPNNVTELLSNLAGSSSNITLYDFRDTGSGVASDIIQKSDAVVVTEDSTSMISEGVAAGLPVVSLSVDGGKKSSDEAYIDLMRSRNWYRTIDMVSATEKDILEELELCTPTTVSHLDILADRLFKQIPELKRFQRNE